MLAIKDVYYCMLQGIHDFLQHERPKFVRRHRASIYNIYIYRLCANKFKVKKLIFKVIEEQRNRNLIMDFACVARSPEFPVTSTLCGM